MLTFMIQNQKLPIDIKETTKDYQVIVEIPGSARDDIKIWQENGFLTITAEKKLPETKRLWAERVSGQFSWTFQLPSDAEVGKIEASYQDGVLNVIIPKSEKAQPKTIEIR